MNRLIAARATAEIGTPFRLHGRTSRVALDCVGLVAVAIQRSDVPGNYSLKGDFSEIIRTYMEQNAAMVSSNRVLADGDVALVGCALNQQHLMVRANNGWVHAHAGLGRVVHMPDPSPWPIIGLWRICGD
jgi:murein DD-endopeptidase / murein LD-carboxypeptidase